MNKISYDILEKEWDYLVKNKVDGLSSKIIPFDSKYDIRIGLDDDMHILVKEDNQEEREKILIAEGLNISFRRLEIGEQKSLYFDLACNPDKKEILLLFIVDFLKVIDDKGPEKAFFSTFKKWKKFWSGKKPKLSASEQRGLLGELLILKKIMEHKAVDVLDFWVGPQNGLRDFEFERIDLEVKTTTRDPPVVSINDPEQVCPGSKKLYLIVVQLMRFESGYSLPDIIKKIREKINDFDELVERFIMLLSSIGYRESDAPYYLERYKNERIIACPIEDNTMIMDPEIIKNVPSSVKNIRYNLHINLLERTITDERFWKETIEEWL